MAALEPAGPINFDVLLYVFKNTLASPFFAGLAVGFSYMVQYHTHKRPPSFEELRLSYVYFGTCWITWFVTWTSRVWASQSWKHGLSGLMGINSIKWDDQIVVVTGGCQGLGRAIVDIFRMKGVSVAVLDRNPLTCDESGDGVYHYQCDVSDYSQVQEAAKNIAKDIGTPTILINNAGVVIGKSLLDLQESDIRKTFGVNTLGPFWTLKAFLPAMLESGSGHIVNISSLLGTIGVANLTDYCASKSAIIGLHDSLQAEVRRLHPESGIRFTLVLPSHIRTSLFARLKPFTPLSAFLMPMLEPHEIATKVVRQIEADQQGEISLPALVNITWLWRGLPSYGRDVLRWVSDADGAMADFHAPSE